MVGRIIAIVAAIGALAGPALPAAAEPVRPAVAEKRMLAEPSRLPSAAHTAPTSAPGERPGLGQPAATGANAPLPAQPVAGPTAATAAQPAAAPPKTALPEPVKVSNDPRPTLGPDTFVATMNAADRYRAIVEAGGWPTVPNEVTRLKPGESGPAAALLRRRLAATGDLSEQEVAGDAFDDALAGALKRFQMRHGLEETGLVGPRTLFHLNVPAAARLKALQASAARLIGSKFPFGERYVAVNIPSATVEAVERGTVARRYVAVVGKPDRPSPTVETRLTSVNFNPTWTVPVSLIRKDIIPHVRKDPGYLAKMKIRLFDATGAEVDPGMVDWSTERAVNYTIRQDAGIDNSLGEVRLDMPNRHAVYMHDTPSKRLFARNMRAQSSGCVRVSGVKELVGWLLDGMAGPDGASSAWRQPEIDAAIASGKRQDVRLTKPVPVAWVYLTGYATADGAVHFRDDVYNQDALSPAPAPGGPVKALTIDALVTSSIGAVR